MIDPSSFTSEFYLFVKSHTICNSPQVLILDLQRYLIQILKTELEVIGVLKTLYGKSLDNFYDCLHFWGAATSSPLCM